MNILKLIDKAIYVCEPLMQINKIKISLFRRNKISFTLFVKTLCTRSTLKVHLFFKASSCETNFVSGNKLFKNSLAKILVGKNQKNKLIF